MEFLFLSESFLFFAFVDEYVQSIHKLKMFSNAKVKLAEHWAPTRKLFYFNYQWMITKTQICFAFVFRILTCFCKPSTQNL